MKKNLYFLNSIKEKLFKSKLLFIALLCTVLQALVFQVRAQTVFDQSLIYDGSMISIYLGNYGYVYDQGPDGASNNRVYTSSVKTDASIWVIRTTGTLYSGYKVFQLFNKKFQQNYLSVAGGSLLCVNGSNLQYDWFVDDAGIIRNTQHPDWCIVYNSQAQGGRYEISKTDDCLSIDISSESPTIRYPLGVFEGSNASFNNQLEGATEILQRIPLQISLGNLILEVAGLKLFLYSETLGSGIETVINQEIASNLYSFELKNGKYDLKINYNAINYTFRQGVKYIFQIRTSSSTVQSSGAVVKPEGGDVAQATTAVSVSSFVAKIVPYYLEWNPKQINALYSENWNEDSNWNWIISSSITSFPYDAFGSFVPAYWTNVKIPKKKDSYPHLLDYPQGQISNNLPQGQPYYVMNSPISDELEYYVESSDKYPRPFRPNWCKNIYFEHGKVIDGAANDEWGAELAHTNYLNYTTAYVDMTLRDNRWYMVSAPLGCTYTGDMHLPKLDPYYDNLYPWQTAADANDWVMFGNVPVVNNRAQPIVYQRVWDKVTVNKPPLAGSVSDVVHAIASEGNWTKAFNALNHKHFPGNGFALGVDMSRAVETPNYGSYDVTFKFPKIEESYRYYNIDGNYPVGGVVNTPRSSDTSFGSVGKFAYTPGNTATTEMMVTLTSEYKDQGGTLVGNRIFLVGNPFMSHLDWAKFLAVNTELKNLYWIYDGTNDNITLNTKSLTDDNDYYDPVGVNYIAPMQSFFVMLKDNVTAKTNLDIIFSSDMMVTKPLAGARLKVAQTRSAVPADLLQIYASRATSQTMAVIVKDARASNDYDGEEDAESIFNAFYPSTPIVYTVAGEKALLKNVMNDPGRVPVGIHTEKEGEVTFLFEGLAGFSNEIIFYDALKQKEYPLDATHNSVVIPDVSSGLGRFFLDFKAVASGVEESATDQLRIYNPEKGKIVISAGVGDKIESVEIYSLSGQLVHSKYQIDKDLTEIGVEGGVYTAKVKTLNNSKACKVIVK